METSNFTDASVVFSHYFGDQVATIVKGVFNVDSKAFDRFTRSWSATAARRTILALFAGSALELNSVLESDAKG